MNKLFMLLIALICLTLSPVISRSQTGEPNRSKKDEAASNEVLRLEEVGRQRVVAGENRWDDIMAAGAYMIGYDGSASTYENATGLPKISVKSMELSELIARPYDTIVVVSALADISAETADKKVISLKTRYIHVWKKLPEGWRIVVSEYTTVKGSQPAPK